MGSIQDFTSAIKAFALSKALMTALDLDLFQLVSTLAGKLSPEEVAARLDLDWTIARPLIYILIASNFLQVRDGKLWLGPKVSDEVMASMHNLKSWNEEMKLTYASLVDLTNVVRTGDYRTTPLAAYWAYRQNPEHRDGGDELTSAYSFVMDESQKPIGKGIAQSYDFSRHSHLVDFGGGYGRLAMTLADIYPQLKVTVIDLPSVCQKTTQLLAEQGYESRIRCIGMDFLKDELSGKADVVSFVRVLHDWDDESAYCLCKRAWQILVPNGVVLICEPLLSDDPASIDPDTTLYAIMVALLGGKRRTFSEYESLLQRVGFDRIVCTPVGVYNNMLIIARKQDVAWRRGAPLRRRSIK